MRDLWGFDDWTQHRKTQKDFDGGSPKKVSTRIINGLFPGNLRSEQLPVRQENIRGYESILGFRGGYVE